MTATEGALRDLFESERRFLWGLCYRLTGCAADADDLVQETFVRALERPPARTDRPWRPWLIRVATNLGRDLLRRRRRRPYVGEWLPSPLETGSEPPSFEPSLGTGPDAERRYELLESVSFAFLIALEALTPNQRAVLLLRDVFDFRVRETAAALGISEASVKTTHLRARRAMKTYDAERRPPTRELQAETRQALERFVARLNARDSEGMLALLSEDVQATSDAGGEFTAALRPIVGGDAVLRLFLGLADKGPPVTGMEFRTLNGLPALVVRRLEQPGHASRFVFRAELDRDGRIRRFHAILATRKLTAIRDDDLPLPDRAP